MQSSSFKMSARVLVDRKVALVPWLLWRGNAVERSLGWVAHTAAAVILFHVLVASLQMVEQVVQPLQRLCRRQHSQGVWPGHGSEEHMLPAAPSWGHPAAACTAPACCQHMHTYAYKPLGEGCHACSTLQPP